MSARLIIHHTAGRLAPYLQSRTFSNSSTTSQATASDAASRLLDTFANTTITRRQLIDANQLHKLALTLNRPLFPNGAAPAAGIPVPPGWHLVYFTPEGVETELGADGTDRTFNASAPFTRRMWAGGSMSWPSSSSQWLKVGDEVEERTRLLSATAKKSRSSSAGEMVLVEVEKEYWGPQGLALTDRRSWVFRPEVVVDPANMPKPLEGAAIKRGPSLSQDIPAAATAGEKDNGFPTRQLHWSPVGLFRFSALTFNGHMIHYNEDWTRRVESHPGVVVHGPLNLISLLQYWQDVHGQGKMPRRIAYRAVAPVYAGEVYQIRTGEVKNDAGGTREIEVLAEKNGVVCMRGEIVG